MTFKIHHLKKVKKKNCIKIIRYIPSIIKHCKPEHFFITGKKGAGKTAFIRYVSHIARDNFRMIPIYINNQKGSSVEELILNLIETLSKEFDKEYWAENFTEGYLKRIQENEFSPESNKKLILSIKSNFSKLLIEICENSENRGMFLIIDDINGLSDNLEFTYWYKSIFESIQFNEYNIPAIFALTSYPEEFDNLCSINESFSRIFKLIEIDKL